MGLCVSSASLDEQESDENIVYVAQDDEFSRSVASLYSQQGKKGPNQDAVILCQDYGMEEGLFCGVFDGHGRSGHVVSKLVRDYLPSLLLGHHNALVLANEEDYDLNHSDNTSPTSSSEDSASSSSSSSSFDALHDWKEACIRAFKAMDHELMLRDDLDCSYSGTTAVCFIKQGKDLIIANLGDSRAVMGTMSDDGHLEAVQLTTDLKPCVAEEAERIRKSNGRIFAIKDEPHVRRIWLPDENYPGLAMTRSFGDLQLKNYGVISTPQLSCHRLTNKDQFIVVATDGVWDVLSNEQVVSIVWSVSRREDASKALVEASVRVWRTRFPSSKVDDCSAICLFFKEKS